jgi:hypothetical protein
MHIKHHTICLFAGLLIFTLTSCGKPVPITKPAPTVMSPDSVLRVHWLGKRQLGILGGAYSLLRNWELPQAKQLESQTLDKLAAAPWTLNGTTDLANVPAALLRPLLDDAIREESFFEIRTEAGGSPEWVFAVQADDKRAGLWRTNLAFVVGSLTGAQSMDVEDRGRGWSIKLQDTPVRVRLSRVGGWTVVGLLEQTNGLVAEIVSRIQRDGAPFVSSGTNLWIEGDADLPRLAKLFPWITQLPFASNAATSNLARLSFNATGDGANVITRGELNFSKPLSLQLPAWTIPAGLIPESLVSFTAVRGIKPWLSTQQSLPRESVESLPNQVYFWSLGGSLAQSYFAAPSPDSGTFVRSTTRRLMEQGNPWLAARGIVGFEAGTNDESCTWGQRPDLKPFIESRTTAQGGFVFGGLSSDVASGHNPSTPTAMFQDLVSRTNAIYYDWEVTGQKIESWLVIGQLARELSRHPILSLDSKGLTCLHAIEPRLDTSATVISLASPNQLTLLRRSSVGLTGLELHLLVDWLESPAFPAGLYSTAQPRKPN